MSHISIDEKVKIASAFLLSSPPGEVNDVFNDVRTLVNDDEGLQDGILQALEKYNTEQHVTVTLPDTDYEIVVSKHGKLEDGRYVDPRSKKSFKFDHMRLSASEVDDHEYENENEVLRGLVEKEAVAYITDHYPFGACSVYCNDRDINIAIVGNKYSPKNFWNGRWLASWNYNTETRVLKGNTKVNVHYYEDGNVQLNTDKPHEATIPQMAVSDYDDPKILVTEF
ncbi:F-actin-capping protein subunit alpha [Pilobolus umbonatus]|nr:F-actin-capping protein subunit alpha [Pilobolus umbonatus]